MSREVVNPPTGRWNCAFVVLATGCAAPAEPTELPAGIEPYEVSCDASRAQSLIGVGRSPGAAAEAMRISGAGVVRWIGPGDGITSDYNSGRVNLETDDAGQIHSVSCG